MNCFNIKFVLTPELSVPMPGTWESYASTAFSSQAILPDSLAAFAPLCSRHASGPIWHPVWAEPWPFRAFVLIALEVTASE